MPMEAAESVHIKSKGKRKEDISGSLEKLHIEEFSTGSAGSSSISFKRKPVIIIVVGMTGSGETMFLHRLVCLTQASNIRGHVMNLDLLL